MHQATHTHRRRLEYDVWTHGGVQPGGDGQVPDSQRAAVRHRWHAASSQEPHAAQCAEAAGYGKKGSYARASELLDYKKNPQVHLEIQNRMAMLREQWAIDRDKHMAMLTKIRDEARIKGQYGVVAKCEELRGKAGGLYIEKSMVITKDIDKKADDEFRELYKTRADFEKSMILMAETMYPNEKSELYDDSTIELTEEEIEMRKRGEELDEYNKMRAKEREKLYKK